MAPPPYLHGLIISKTWNRTNMATDVFFYEKFSTIGSAESVEESDQYLKEWEVRGKRAIEEGPLDLEEKETCILFVDLDMAINSNYKFIKRIKHTYVIILYHPYENMDLIERCKAKGAFGSTTLPLTPLNGARIVDNVRLAEDPEHDLAENREYSGPIEQQQHEIVQVRQQQQQLVEAVGWGRLWKIFCCCFGGQ